MSRSSRLVGAEALGNWLYMGGLGGFGNGVGRISDTQETWYSREVVAGGGKFPLLARRRVLRGLASELRAGAVIGNRRGIGVLQVRGWERELLVWRRSMG